MSELDKFLKERAKIPIPSGDVARIKLLAKELALGVNEDLWSRSLWDSDTGIIGMFLNRRWSSVYRSMGLEDVKERLRAHDFCEEFNGNDGGKLKPSAFALLLESEPYNVFISYRRLDSSALALLVLARLKEHSLVPFVDMALEAGGNWHADLEERIKACDYFIILLGKETLASDMTAREICWAIDSQRTIIPFWHGEFGKQDDFDLGQYIVKLAANWNDANLVSRIADVRDVIQQTNAIRVTDESASGYNSAIVELLNRFGITP